MKARKLHKHRSSLITKFVVWVVLFPICVLFMLLFAFITRSSNNKSFIYDDIANRKDNSDIDNSLALASAGIEPYSTIYGFDNN